jgi:serine/threonine-protein kinase
VPPVASSPGVAPVREGEILDGKYRVERVLGVGGMGVVVAATHVQLQTRVALKFLLPEVLGHPQVVHRFVREARAAVQIQSEHVARVTDVGTLSTGSPYMVMEYLEGEDLSKAVAGSGALPVARAVGYVLQACEAIAEAHALGIVHRDLKPANLFLARRTGRDSIVKVLDFGISKTNDPGPSGLTQTSNVMGSPQYMAPEQMMSSKNVDVRADVWALGVILFELLTGERPFLAETMAEIVYMVTQGNPPRLLDKRPDLPPGLGDAVAKALVRDPAQRTANVAVFAAAIAPFGPPRSEISVERIARVLGTTVPATPEPPAPAPSPAPAASPTSHRLEEEAPARPKGRGLVAVGAGALVLVAAVVAWRALSRSEAGREGPSTPAAATSPAHAVASPPVAQPPPVVPPAAAVAVRPPPVARPPAEPPAPERPTTAAAPTPARHPTYARTKATKSHGPSAPHAAQPAAATPSAAPAKPGLNMGMKE